MNMAIMMKSDVANTAGDICDNHHDEDVDDDDDDDDDDDNQNADVVQG